MFVIPKPVTDFGIPGCGDSLIIPEVAPPANRPVISKTLDHRIHLATLPKNPASNDSIRVILQDNARKIRELAPHLSFCPIPFHPAGELRLAAKSMVENYRSVLDYLARDIATICGRKHGKLYFPIAGVQETETEFRNRLKHDFPSLIQANSVLFQYLIDIQRFKDEPWLEQLGRAANQLKHHELGAWKEIDCRSVLIHHDGVGVRVGALGLKSIKLEERSVLGIASKDGQEYDIRGPDLITVESKSLRDADVEILFERQVWRSFGIAGVPHSLIHFLCLVDANIRRVCTGITGCLEDKNWKPW